MSLLQRIQIRVGAAPDGKWGPATEAAVAKALGCGGEGGDGRDSGGGAERANAHALADPAAFFTGLRKVTGPLDDMQVDIINALLISAARWPIGWMAYALATAWHEARLRPVEEIGKGRGHAYGVVDGTGKAPYGRGLIQLTWHSNYVRADDALGLDGTLAGDYDRALEPDIAVQILVRGMEEGWFTGKALPGMIPSPLGTDDEFVRARRIVNGTDRAERIAVHADGFKSALLAGGWA